MLHRTQAAVTFFCVGLTIYFGGSARAQIVNGGFETGDFTGWQTLGTTSTQNAGFGVIPAEGNYQALITNESLLGTGIPTAQVESFLGLTSGTLDSLGNGPVTQGSAIVQAITVSAGERLSFSWDFLTNEFPSSSDTNDFAFVTLSQNRVFTLANTFSPLFTSNTPFTSETGYETFSYTFATQGTYSLGVGVVDVGDTFISSGVLVDNFRLSAAAVPEPRSLILLGFGCAAVTGIAVVSGRGVARKG